MFSPLLFVTVYLYASLKFKVFYKYFFVFQFSYRYRTQWISSLHLTLSRLHCQESYGRYLRNKRRLEWHRVRIKRQFEIEKTKEMLEAEKTVCKILAQHLMHFI